MIDDRLRRIVERIERLLEERAGISQDIRDVYGEAKAVGYDTVILRKVIARRAMKPEDRAECDLLVETYEAALGQRPEAELQTDDVELAAKFAPPAKGKRALVAALAWAKGAGEA